MSRSDQYFYRAYEQCRGRDIATASCSCVTIVFMDLGIPSSGTRGLVHRFGEIRSLTCLARFGNNSTLHCVHLCAKAHSDAYMYLGDADLCFTTSSRSVARPGKTFGHRHFLIALPALPVRKQPKKRRSRPNTNHAFTCDIKNETSTTLLPYCRPSSSQLSTSSIAPSLSCPLGAGSLS
jgi:hypothetical protein